ncbi:Neuromedin-U receptor 2 [Trichoplax sp. H2]|nr:Neuromedin-U receptor 2 [Trichoplax sp. H2]|eukprot:RDD46558.1 Neuromedin-U receptor 2 [Trichoplax sp. H2]
MNISNSTFSNITNKKQVLMDISQFSIGIVGIIMNLLVCLIFGTHRNLHRPFNYLLVSLSISDLVISFSITFNLFVDILGNSFLSIIGTMIICKFSYFSGFTSTCATALTLMVISIERYQAIASMHVQKLKLSSTRKLILIIWMLSAAGAVIPTIYAGIILRTYYDCTIAVINIPALIICSILLSLLCLLPTIAMFALYFIIIYKLLKTDDSKKLEINSITERRQKILRHNILPIVGISIFSAASTIPYLLLTGLYLIGNHMNPNFMRLFYAQTGTLYPISSLFFIICPVINPLLFNFASREYRKSLFSMLRCNYPDRIRTNIIT